MATESPFDSAKALFYNNNGRSESELVTLLETILKNSPDVANEVDDDGWTLLHHAARLRSPEFCRLLIDMNSNLVRTADNMGQVPFHLACSWGNVQTAKYLHNMYPESINIPDRFGNYPLHMLMNSFTYPNTGGRNKDVELTQFLLQYLHQVAEVTYHCIAFVYHSVLLGPFWGCRVSA